MGVYVSIIAIYGRRVDSAVAAATTAFQRLNAQSCNLYMSVVLPYIVRAHYKSITRGVLLQPEGAGQIFAMKYHTRM